MLAQAGLREEEDVFASVWKSFQNRWTWLAINLVTAFIASRVIGVFEGSIQQLVALAALMPIVAGIGGNSGNQTITMIVRAAALGQVDARAIAPADPQGAHRRAAERARLGRRHGHRRDAAVPAASRSASSWLLAMTLNLMLAALMGVLIPMTLLKLGRDPAVGLVGA